MKKIIITILGGAITLLGLLLIIIPGPAWLLLPIGLAILSLEYPQAKKLLKRSQTYMKRSAMWLDQQLARRSGK